MQNESSPEQTPREIVSDEDWKARVKAEAAELDAAAKPEQTETTPAEESPAEAEAARKQRAEQSQKIDASQLPPANIMLLISMFSTQAMSALGLFPNPVTGQIDLQLALAKHYIDLLAVLEQKTAGNLTSEEAQMLGGTLHELRMIFVQQSKVTV